MDILRFVESNAIKEYWKKIGYEPNSLESAYLIYRCGDATMKEKHDAWNELIKTMPDCSVEKRNEWMTAQKSLHDFLRRYMAAEDRYAEYIKNTINDANDTSLVSISPFYDYMSVGRLSDLNNDGSEESLAFFEGLFFSFPLPFRTGDIVWDPACCDEELYLIIEDCNKAEAELPSKYKHMYEHGDTTDMQIDLAAADEHGVSFTHKDYLGLEYYTKELKGLNRHLEEYRRMLLRRTKLSD